MKSMLGDLILVLQMGKSGKNMNKVIILNTGYALIIC